MTQRRSAVDRLFGQKMTPFYEIVENLSMHQLKVNRNRYQWLAASNELMDNFETWKVEGHVLLKMCSF